MDTNATTTRRIEQRPEQLWESLTSPEGFEAWMGTGSTIDPAPGGDLVAADPASGSPKIGRVLVAKPSQRLRWVWRDLGDDPDATTEVAIDLKPDWDEETAATITVITVVEAPSPLRVPRPLRTNMSLATC